MSASDFIVILCAIACLACAWLAGYSHGAVKAKVAERRRCIRKLTGHLPGPGPLRETWLRAMLDEV